MRTNGVQTLAVWRLGRRCNHHILDVNTNSNNVTGPSLG
jgi:hypothetical protein